MIIVRHQRSQLFALACLALAFGLPTAASAQQVVLPNFSSTAGLSLNSAVTTANSVPADGTVLRLAAPTTNDVGSVFTTAPLNVATGFSTSFKFRLSSPGGVSDSTGATGADGLVMVIQRSGASALGGGGGGIGYLGLGSSVGVEFDTWYNPENGDPNSNHVGLNTGGSVTSVATANVTPAFDNGAKWTAWVDYNGSLLEVRMSPNGIRPASALLSHSLNLASTIGGSTAHIGFTAATGGAYATHDLLTWAFSDAFRAGGITMYTWAGSGSWTDTARWDPAAIPGANDLAWVSSGIANVNEARAVGALQFSGGTLGGSGTLTLAAPGSVWTGGAMTGTGTLKVAAGASLEIGGTSAKIYNRADGYGSDGRKIENLGTITWTGAGNLQGGDGGQILNQTEGLFDLKSDATLAYTGGGNTPVFANAGTFRKSAGTGTSTVSNTTFINSGLVDAQTGTLAFSGGVTSNAGTFSAATGTSLLFSGGQTFNTGTSFIGAGAIRIAGGTTSVSGNITTQNLAFTAGTLQGTAAISGTLAWTDGVWSGTGTLTINSGATLGISGNANKTFNRADGYGSGGRIIENLGTITWTGTGGLLGGDGGQIINRGSGTFLVQNDATLGHTGGGSGPTITNEGTFRKNTATGTTTISGGTFVNSGLVDAQAGTLAFSSSVTSNAGAFNATANSTIEFLGGQTFNEGTSFSSPAGKIRIVSGATTISGNLTASGFEFAGGDLYGSGTISGSAAWTAGTWRSDGIVSFAPDSTLTLSGAADKNLVRADGYGSGGRILRTAGTLVWTEAGRIAANDGAGIDLLSGGTFEIRNGSSFVHGGGGSIPFLTNAGTVRKLAASGTTTFESIAFTNTGRLELQGGSLSLSGAGGLANEGVVELLAGTLTSAAAGLTSTGGTFSVLSGAQLRYTGGTNTIVNSAFTGAGLTEVAGGTLLVSGASVGGNFRLSSGAIGGGGAFTVNSGGNFNWSGGSLTGTGTLAIARGGSLQIDGSAVKSLYRGDGYGSGGRTITNAGTTTWSGTGSILGGDGAAFSNLAGGLFDAQSDATFGHTGGGNGPTFSNAGTVRKSAGTGATILALPFVNSGTAESQSGTLRLTGGGSGGGQFIANGGTIDFASSYTLASGARLVGPNLIKLTTGTLSVPATATLGGTEAGHFALEGGLLDGAGVFLVGNSGHLDWSGGSLAGTGTLRVAVGGELNILGAVAHQFYRGDGAGSGGRTIENLGTVNWGAGELRGGDGAQFINGLGGLIDITGGGSFGFTGGGNSPTFTNAGTLRKSAGATTTFAHTAFTSSGLVQVNAGSLIFTSGVTSNAGTFFAAPSTTLTFSGGQSFNPGTSFTGAGLMQATAGATSLSGKINATHFVFAGGSLYGSATLNGTMEWSGGDLRGADTLGIGPGSTLLITGAGNRAFIRGDGYGSGGRTIENFGRVVVDHAGDLLGGDGASIINRSGGVFELRTDRSLGYTGGGNVPSFLNEGVFTKTAGTGTSTIAIPFINTGNIVIASGALAFTSTFTNTGGGMTLANGASFATTGTLDLGAAPLSGTGTITAAEVRAGGLVSPGSSPGQLTLTGNLTLLNTSTTLFELGGTNRGVDYDFMSVGGTASLGGTLELKFVNNFQASIKPSDTFTLLTTSSFLPGTFSNVPSTGFRLSMADGQGSFLVNFGSGSALASNSLVLTSFVPVPEPSTYALLCVGGGLLLFGAMRRRR